MSMVEPLLPWAEGNDNTPLERQLSRLFGAVPQAEALPDLARQRIALGLHTRASRGARLMLVRLVALGIIIGMAGAAAAQWASSHLFGSQHEVVARPTRVVVAAPPLVPQPSLPQKAEPALAPAAEPVAAPAVGAAVAPTLAPVQNSRLGLEAASLEAALSALRAGGAERAGRALQALDQHLREFPRGTLELEARVARVDALLLLGRRQEARRALTALPIENVGRKNELRLIRAELRADDDCRSALSDFQVLVDQPLTAAWAERALFGRGACLLKLGDKAGAERDFARYLTQFPNGRFAAQIRAQTAQ
jgi:tetratricopeptide (TPR) repeat protein